MTTLPWGKFELREITFKLESFTRRKSSSDKVCVCEQVHSSNFEQSSRQEKVLSGSNLFGRKFTAGEVLSGSNLFGEKFEWRK